MQKSRHSLEVVYDGDMACIPSLLIAYAHATLEMLCSAGVVSAEVMPDERLCVEECESILNKVLDYCVMWSKEMPTHKDTDVALKAIYFGAYSGADGKAPDIDQDNPRYKSAVERYNAFVKEYSKYVGKATLPGGWIKRDAETLH